MKVLVISHNVISETNNMGKTLLSYFQDFSPDEVAEFYIQDKVPVNASVVRSYYRVTDRDALKSVFGFKAGTAFKLEESLPEKESAKTGVLENIRQYGRKRNAIVYTLRNAVWLLSHWNTKRFKAWLKDFDPDVIFFMAGDYSFMFKITLTVQKALNKPLAVCCVDDFFMYNRNEKTALGRHQHRSYKKIFRRVMEKASCIFTISDSMGEIYRKLFGKPCFTLHTSAPKRISADDEERKGISYFGNLGFKRFEQLSDIGKAVKKLCIPGFDCISVYSGEKKSENLAGLTAENGVRFCGEISPAEVCEKMDRSTLVIHTESFDSGIREIIKYSVSTKIADSLINGPCILAYGPEGIASIDYLKTNNAAYVITDPEDLENGLREIMTNGDLRTEIVKNARTLAAKNHDPAVNPKKIKKWLKAVVDGCIEDDGYEDSTD